MYRVRTHGRPQLKYSSVPCVVLVLEVVNFESAHLRQLNLDFWYWKFGIDDQTSNFARPTYSVLVPMSVPTVCVAIIDPPLGDTVHSNCKILKNLQKL